MNELIFPIIQKVADVSEKNALPVYAVGGFVRDILMNRSFKQDIDFVVEGSGLAFAKLFDETLEKQGSLIEFPDFDTARYIVKDGNEEPVLQLEFAGARSEKYEENSRKPVVSQTTLAEDLKRRDFTVNAMAVAVKDLAVLKELTFDAIKSLVIDPFGGEKDLQEKILKTPLDPDITFSDDPLRMLRAIRFATQLNFAIDPVCFEAIVRNRERLKIISYERIQEELFKLLSCPVPSVGLQLMYISQIMDIILPEISALDGVEDVYGHSHKNNLTHSFKVVDNIAERSDKLWLRLAGLLHDIGKPATKRFVPKIGWTFHAHEHVGKKMVYALGKRFKFSNDLTKYIAHLVRWHLQPISLMDDGITDSAVRRLIVEFGDEIHDLLILGRGDITTGNPYKKERRLKNYDILEQRVAEVIEKDKLRAFQSPVRGEEIMSICGLKPGPTIGKIKTALEEAILDGIIPNEYEAVKAYFLFRKDAFLENVQDWEKSL